MSVDMAETRNGGGTATECERADITHKDNEMWVSAGKTAAQKEIRGLMGPGHEEGTKALLIDRAVETATIICLKRDREEHDAGAY